MNTSKKRLVGVEQTINSGFKETYSRAKNVVPYGEEIPVHFNPRWANAATKFKVTFVETGKNQKSVRVTRDGKVIEEGRVEREARLIFGLTNAGAPFFIGNKGSLRDVPESIRLCKILEISELTSAGVVAILNDCLAGPQTPEKAKQASYVALDIRRGRFGQFDKVLPPQRESARRCRRLYPFGQIPLKLDSGSNWAMMARIAFFSALRDIHGLRRAHRKWAD